MARADTQAIMQAILLEVELEAEAAWWRNHHHYLLTIYGVDMGALSPEELACYWYDQLDLQPPRRISP